MKVLVMTLKESVQVRVTDQLGGTEGQVRILHESKRARGTHILLSVKGGTNQDTKEVRQQEALTSCLSKGWCQGIEGKRMSERYSPTSEHEGKTSNEIK
jgi:hypothetical protein